MKRLTVDDVMAMGPCDDYPRERVAGLWAGRVVLTAREIGALDINTFDRAWVLARMIQPREARLWACDFAEETLIQHWTSDDRRPHEALRVARLLAVGEATAEELVAARAVAYEAWLEQRCADASQAAWEAWIACRTEVGDAVISAVCYAWDTDRESLYARIEESAE